MSLSFDDRPRSWRVLFEDLNGIWSPLTSMFWSSSSYCLVSRHPRSCVEEVETIYCPQCFTKYTDDEAIQKHKGRCIQCKICVACESPCIVTSSPDKNENILKCYFCNWSIPCNKISSSALPVEDKIHLRDVIQFWTSNLSARSVNTSAPTGTTSEFPTFIDQSGPSKEDLTYVAGVRLQSKNIIRCRKDVEEFSENILVQRRPLPLDGDSSTMLHKGKWFMKDQFAIKEIPSVHILPHTAPFPLGLANQDPGDYVIVRLVNPRDTMINVKVKFNYANLGSNNNNSSSSSSSSSIHEKIKTYDDVIREIFGVSCIPIESPTHDFCFIDARIGPYEDELLQAESDQIAYRKFNPGKSLLAQRSNIPEISHQRSTTPAPSTTSKTSNSTTGNTSEFWTFRNMVEFLLYFPKRLPLESAEDAYAMSITLAISCEQAKYTVKSKILCV